MIGRLLRVIGLSAVAALLADRFLAERDGEQGVPAIDSLVVVDAPIADVWAIVADVAGQPRWMRDLKAITFMTSGPVGRGTRAVGRVRILGVPVEDVVEITAFEPPTRFAIRHEGLVAGSGEIRLEPGVDGTTTIVRWSERLAPPVLPHLAARLQAPLLRWVFQEDLHRLARLVETRGAGEEAGQAARAAGSVARLPA